MNARGRGRGRGRGRCSARGRGNPYECLKKGIYVGKKIGYKEGKKAGKKFGKKAGKVAAVLKQRRGRLEDRTLRELGKWGKKYKIPRYGSMTKAQLIYAIRGVRGQN